MNNSQFFIYLFIVVVTTYLIRVIPFNLISKKINNVFIKSFLYYIPYAVLTAMTIPAAFYATNHIISAVIGLITAIILSMFNKSLTFVAVFSCIAVFLSELILIR